MPGPAPGICVFASTFATSTAATSASESDAVRRTAVSGGTGNAAQETPMTKSFRTLDDVNVKGKRVLLRVDLNVPMEGGRVTDATRLERVAPTITEISDKGGKVILLAHFGRPKGRDPKDSLKPVAEALSKVIKRPVAFAEDCIGEPAARPSRHSRMATSSASRIPASTRKRKRTTPASSLNSPSSATSGSTTRSPPRIAPTPRPKASATSCRPMPAAPCRPSSTHWARRWKPRPSP